MSSSEENFEKSDPEYYGFMGPAIPAKNMNDKIVGIMYYIQDGLKYRLTHNGAEEFESNVAAYCVRQIDKYATAGANTNNGKVRQILIAMLNYGSAAQVEFKYNTTAVEGDIDKGLVNLRLDASLRKSALADFADVTTTAERKETDTEKATKFDFYSNSAELKQRIVTKFYFNLAGGNTQADLGKSEFRATLVTTKGTSNYVIDGSEFVYDTKYKDVCVSLADPAAADLGTAVVGAMYDKETGEQVSETVTACFEAYAASQLGKTNVTDTNKALLKAIIAYSRAAYARYR